MVFLLSLAQGYKFGALSKNWTDWQWSAKVALLAITLSEISKRVSLDKYVV